MYFEHPSGGSHPPERDEAHIHAIYRKLFTLVKSMEKPTDIAQALVHTLLGFFGADGAAQCHISDKGADVVAAIGSVSHVLHTTVDLENPLIAQFLAQNQARCLARRACRPEFLAMMNARFESMIAVPVAIDGKAYGFVLLVSDCPDYFESKDADTLREISRFLAMLLENRLRDLAARDEKLYEILGLTCHRLAPQLHTAVIDLIQTFAQIRRSYADQKYPNIAEPLQRAVSNIENMAKRVQGLRTLGEICTPKPMEETNLQIPEIVQNVIAYNRAQIDECAELRLTMGASIPEVRGDTTLIWQTIHEVIQNAIHALSRATREDKVMTVSVYSLPAAAVIEIADNGDGIEPADVPHLFEPLFSHAREGHGLGLSRAQINALRLDGSISYHPAEGGGSIFRITYPDAQHAPQREVF